MKRAFSWLVCLAACTLPFYAAAKPALLIKTLAEKRVATLPSGELFWRIENFPSLEDAKTASGPYSLATEADGKAWLFTLGSQGELSPHGTKVAEVGPIARVSAREYLLRINDASGPLGAVTPVHSHPGSEAVFVLHGEQSIRSAHGLLRIQAGHAEAGHGPDQPMQVSSSGTTDLHALVMFLLDAKRSFSSPAKLP